MTGFRCVADNLRESFRVLAAGRQKGDVLELPGISIASAGVTFQMFNAAFLSERVETQSQLESRLRSASEHFDHRQLPWSCWMCEDWLDVSLRRNLSRVCQSFQLSLCSEMPGMAATKLHAPVRSLPAVDFCRAVSGRALDDFRAIGSTCFHVPIRWFSEVFDDSTAERDEFVCWVGYRDEVPVCTAATVSRDGVTGLYNVATAPEFRQHGYAEAITRHAIEAALREASTSKLILQSTAQGLRLYKRIGFQPVTRILVYNSGR